MKVRIKFSNNKKFIAVLEGEHPTLYELKVFIRNFIKSSYAEERSNIILSFNGTDAIRGEENASLSSVGIVNGDLLTVLNCSEGPESSSSCSVEFGQSSVSNMEQISSSQESGSSVISINESTIGRGNSRKITTLLEAVEGEPPQTVLDAFDRYDPSNSSQVMNILIHLAVLERGFFIENGQSSRNSVLPISWKDMVCTLKYHHPGFNNFVCTIVIVTMGDIKQVLVSFEGQESEISVRLETKTYVPSSQLLPHRLSKIAQLARVVRNDLLHPLQVAAHLTLGLPAPWHIAGLPQEIVIYIASLLPLTSVLSLGSTCKRLNAACKDNKLWFLLFKRDFKDVSHSSDTISGADWQAKYEDLMKKKKSKKSTNLFIPPPIPLPMIPPDPYRPPIDPFNPFMPQPRAPNPYPPPDPYPNPNPYYDPDSPYFGGEIPPMPDPFFPIQPRPRIPFGGGPRFPGNQRSRPARGGPRFDYF